MVRVLWTTLTLIAVTLAGCADDAPAAQPEDDFGQELQATDDTGVIRGVVIDPSIVPVANAQVRIDGGESTTTNEDGEFGFQTLPPGSYFLTVSKLGFTQTQTSVNVEAGEDRPPILKVLLEQDPTSTPYTQTYTFEGFLQCSVRAGASGVGSVGGNACSLFDATGEPLDEPLIAYDLERAPDWIQTEMVWDSTQPLGDSLELLHSWDCDTNAGFMCDHGTRGASPLTTVSNETVIAQAGFGTTAPLTVRVFGDSADASQDTAGATFDQRFTQFTTVFYGFQPDEGWTFLENGEHALPS